MVAGKSEDHPTYKEMITGAITSLNEKKGSSRVAIAKYIKANFKVGDNADTQIKMALKRNVVSGHLIQVTGIGASGSFKLAVKPKTVAKKTTSKVAKKAATKKAAAKKTPVKKPAAKKTTKSPAKKKPAKSPKKVAAAKKSKKPSKKASSGKKSKK